MFCGKCGHEVSQKMSYCPKCGSRLNQGNVPANRPRKKSLPGEVKPEILEYGMGIVFLIWCVLWLKESFEMLDETTVWLYELADRGYFPYLLLVWGLSIAYQCLDTGLGFFDIHLPAIGMDKSVTYQARCIFNLTAMFITSLMVPILSAFLSAFSFLIDDFGSVQWSTLVVTIICFAITILKARMVNDK